tara:strand:- start:67 stop:522 length:456 start_codon:yes stop_codon:yes gene_type:complete
MKTIENNFDDIKVNELLKKHFIELRSVSPSGSAHVLSIDGLKNETIKFWSIWDNKDLIGCGAIKILGQNLGELKSIRVHDKFREKGYGKRIISILITKSKSIGIKSIFIETGSGKFFEPARKLFKSCGFEECDPFGHYKNDPNSCYMKIKI